MKPKTWTLAIAVPAAILIMASCNQPKNQSAQIQSDTTTVVKQMDDSLSMARRDWEQFKADSKQKISDDRDSIKTIKANMDKAGGKMKAKYDKEVGELNKKADELQAKLDNFNEESKEKWDKFKRDFKADMDTLGMRIEKIGKKDKS